MLDSDDKRNIQPQDEEVRSSTSPIVIHSPCGSPEVSQVSSVWLEIKKQKSIMHGCLLYKRHCEEEHVQSCPPPLQT